MKNSENKKISIYCCGSLYGRLLTAVNEELQEEGLPYFCDEQGNENFFEFSLFCNECGTDNGTIGIATIKGGNLEIEITDPCPCCKNEENEENEDEE